MAEFTIQELTDMVFVYAVCGENAVAAVNLYQERYPARRLPNRKSFQRVWSKDFERLGRYSGNTMEEGKDKTISLMPK